MSESIERCLHLLSASALARSAAACSRSSYASRSLSRASLDDSIAERTAIVVTVPAAIVNAATEHTSHRRRRSSPARLGSDGLVHSTGRRSDHARRSSASSPAVWWRWAGKYESDLEMTLLRESEIPRSRIVSASTLVCHPRASRSATIASSVLSPTTGLPVMHQYIIAASENTSLVGPPPRPRIPRSARAP